MSLCTLVILLCLSKLDLFCQSYTTENPAKEKSQKNNTENAALEKSQKNINKMQQEPLTVSQPDLPRWWWKITKVGELVIFMKYIFGRSFFLPDISPMVTWLNEERKIVKRHLRWGSSWGGWVLPRTPNICKSTKMAIWSSLSPVTYNFWGLNGNWKVDPGAR